MTDKTLTGANSVIMLGATGLIDVPRQLQGFAADDVFDTDSVNSAETVDGVDGIMSAGWIYASVQQGYSLQADSNSMDFFETIYSAQKQVQEVYRLFGTIYLPATQKVYTMTRGVLQGYVPIPSVKKLIQPRKFSIKWEHVTEGPL